MQVLHVTSLGDDGPGTLRDAISRADNGVLSVIVFDVGGYITLSSRIVLSQSCLYIAGQTAPGGGITVKAPDIQGIFFGRRPVHDVVVRYLRFRNGTNQPGLHSSSQGIIIGAGQRVVLDHLSFSWGNDQLLSIYRYAASNGGQPVSDISVQRSLFAEPLASSPVCYSTKGGVDPDPDGIPPWFKVTGITFHHNVAIDCDHRAPMMSARTAEVINNVVYNYNLGGVTADRKTYADIIGNYFKAGPMNRPLDAEFGYEIEHPFIFNKPGGWSGDEPAGYVVMGDTNNVAQRCGYGLYLSGNVGPHNPSGSKDDWSMTSKYKGDQAGPYPEAFGQTVQYGKVGLMPVRVEGCPLRRTSPLTQPSIPVTVQSANQAWNDLVVNGDVGDNRRLTCTGAWSPNADAVDKRVLAQAINGTGPGQGEDPASQDDVGGFPTLDPGTPCLDSDGDGMPDEFEVRYGLDPHNAADAATDSNGDGYSNLEEYLNGTAPH